MRNMNFVNQCSEKPNRVERERRIDPKDEALRKITLLVAAVQTLDITPSSAINGIDAVLDDLARQGV